MNRWTMPWSLTLVLVLGVLGAPAEAQVFKAPGVEPAQKRVPPAQKVAPSPALVAPSPPARTGPGTKDLPGNSSLNLPTSAPGLDPGSRMPGAGGSLTGQPPSQSTPALPADKEGLANRARPEDKGRRVGPEYFSKEQQLKDLTDPRAGTKDAGDSADRSRLGHKTGQDLLGGTPTTVTPGYGKNTTSDREEHSTPGSVSAPFVPSSGGITTPSGGDRVYDSAGNNLGSPAALNKAGKEQWSGGLTQSDLAATAKEGVAKDADNKDITTEQAERMKAQQEKEIKEAARPKADGGKKTPNPETDTGDGHNPTGGILGAIGTAPKSPREVEAERKRQVTLPGEGPAQPDRVYMSPEDLLKGGVRQRTDGRIDPGDPTAATPGGAGQGTAPRPGFGPERVDGRVGQPGFAGSTLTVPQIAPPRGSPPDSPTASQGATTSGAPSTSTDRSDGGTAGDGSRRP